jgi:ElaB/YqjD/DUF883 family membrane-anchored ribosome-binding protein
MTSDFSSDDAFARLEKEMTAMKDAISGLSDQIADAAGDLGAAAQEQAKRGVKYAREHGGDAMVAAASDRASAAASAAQSQASSLGDALEDAVRERPISAVALALGLGFMIGVVWRR